MTAPHRILIVEDSRAVARDLEWRVNHLGFAVAGVTPSGEQAVALAENERPDLVLMDIRLQGEMDGIAAADFIRSKLHIPVVFLTAHADDATLRAASVTEAFGYIIKPAQERELRVVIEMALYKHAAEQQRRVLEQQVRRSEKMDAIGQLAGGVAHDFNNILMAILGNCRTLLEQLPAEQRTHHQVVQIRTAAERAAHLTRQLLAFGRDDQEQAVPLDLAAHIRRTSGMLAQLISDDIAVAIDIAPGLRGVLGRSSELEQVIMNLMLNARDAMPRGGILTVAAHNARDADEVMLTVTDTGEGMDEITRGRIFEPFFTTKDVGAGTGLGLATVYAVLGRSRGRIDVVSELGKGSTFTVWLPATGAVSEVAHQVNDDLGPPLEGRIVLVEDDAAVREVVCDILEQAGLHVIQASDGLEALQVCRQAGRVDLVLSDVVMPKLGGADLARILAVDAPHTKVIYMSGYPNRALPGGRAVDLGPVLRKPFTPRQLLDWIREALQSKAA